MSAASNTDQSRRPKIEFKAKKSASNVARKAWPEDKYTVKRPAAFNGRSWARKTNGEIAAAASAAYAQPLEILNPMSGPEDGEVLAAAQRQTPAQHAPLSDVYAQLTGLGKSQPSLRINSLHRGSGGPATGAASAHHGSRNKVWRRTPQLADEEMPAPYPGSVAFDGTPASFHAAANPRGGGGGGGGNAAFREGYEAAQRALTASREGSYTEAQQHAAIVAAMQPDTRKTAAQDGFRARIEEELESTYDPALKAELRTYRKIAFGQQQPPQAGYGSGSWRDDDGDGGGGRKQRPSNKYIRSVTPEDHGGRSHFRKGPRDIHVAVKGKEKPASGGGGSGSSSGKLAAGKRTFSLMHSSGSKGNKWEASKKGKPAAAEGGSGKPAPKQQATKAPPAAAKPISLDQKLNMSLDALSGNAAAKPAHTKAAAPAKSAASGGGGKHQAIVWQPQ